MSDLAKACSVAARLDKDDRLTLAAMIVGGELECIQDKSRAVSLLESMVDSVNRGGELITDRPPELSDGNNVGHVLTRDVVEGRGRLVSSHVDWARAKELAWVHCPDFEFFGQERLNTCDLNRKRDKQW